MRDRILDLQAIADELGVPKNTVNVWRYRGVLPEPDITLAVGPLWYWETIKTWAIESGRLA